MNKLFYICFLFCALNTKAQNLYFPPNTGNTWDTISPTSLGWCQNKVDSLVNMLGQENSKAFIVLKDGKIVIEKYYGTFTQDSLWYWASAGKTLTGFLVGIAQQEGYLNIDSATSKYIGNGWSVAPSNKEKMITVKNQLCMTTGLNDGVADNHCTDDTCMHYLADAGTRWAYHNAPYTILDTVIESATNQNFNTYFNSRIRNKIGMNGFYFYSGYDHVYLSNARSFARFGLLLLNNGTWSNTAVLSDSNYFQQMTNTSQALNKSYGYLTWLNGKQNFMMPETQIVFPGYVMPHAPGDMHMALGKNGQFINVVPSMNLVLIRMGNPPQSNNPLPVLLNDNIWAYLNDAMCNVSSTKKIIENKIRITPNPATDFIEIKSTEPILCVDIYSEIGELIASYTSSKIATSHLTKGLYLVKVNTKNSLATSKFLKE